MQYQQVYGGGPLDNSEPLYHSDPFYLDVNSNPEHKNITASFVDNYSQIVVDFGKTNSGYIKLGTRFGGMDFYGISANTVPEIVRLYTGLVGRQKLKPRYILGNHQACFGYMNEGQLHDVVRQYRDVGFPLDGLHIDVDFQDNFRTFTTNPDTFPHPKEMFETLRTNGIKCSTNITPVISVNDRQGSYSTLTQGLKAGYFLKDERYTVGTTGNAKDVLYTYFDSGEQKNLDPNSKDFEKVRPDFEDYYNFDEQFNTGKPFRGAVGYGYKNGTPGHYPDLNQKKIRIWWGLQYEYLFNLGLEFVWQDMTTPAIDKAYGDMKGFPSRLWVNYEVSDEPYKLEKRLAIDCWALYSYNLHKATYHGLNRLPIRRNKRNFILGRGSFAGAYRYAGLWTGDNASRWDFWRITVSQVLSLGLNGVCIAGSDTGGFEPASDHERYCSPELLIRWYAGSYLLPWLRNHYVRKHGRKWFQEPYAYPRHFNDKKDTPDALPSKDESLYHAVLEIPRYYVQLRYSLIQLLYDAMFENAITGMPIARSMLLTDTEDTTFFNETQKFLDNQYMAGDNILVAPVMNSAAEAKGENRDVYLPLKHTWYKSNLTPCNKGVKLTEPVEGGRIINCKANIVAGWDSHLYPDVTPTYIREGAIIPQIEVRQYINEGPANPITFNIYPGKDQEYFTYLDDGVSRDSAPNDLPQYRNAQDQEKAETQQLQNMLNEIEKDTGHAIDIGLMSPEPDNTYDRLDARANGSYCKISVKQHTKDQTRTVTINRIYGGYDPQKEVGDHYIISLWYAPDFDKNEIDLRNATIEVNGATNTPESNNDLKKVTIVVNEVIGTSPIVTIKVTTN